MINNFVLVAIGGALGAIARYSVSLIPITGSFPWQTFIINLFGCFIIGIITGLLKANTINESMYLVLAVGFCGGFTTFSSFSAESLQLLQNDKIVYFAAYTGLSVVLGLFATFLGLKLIPVK